MYAAELMGLLPPRLLPSKLSQQRCDRVGLLLPELWGHMPVPRLHTPVLRLTLDLCPSFLAMALPLVLPSQGCYTVILNAFETYVYLAGALAIGVLAIEVSKGPRFCSSSEARQTPTQGLRQIPHGLRPQPASVSRSLTRDPVGPHCRDDGQVSPAVPICCLRVTLGLWTHLSKSVGSGHGQALRVAALTPTHGPE